MRQEGLAGVDGVCGFGRLRPAEFDALFERRQHSVAGALQVYVPTNPHKRGFTPALPVPRADTRTLTRAALWALKHLFKPGYAYQKAGVMLMELRDAGGEQGQLFTAAPPDRPALMQVIDRANAHWGTGTLRLAS